MTRTRTRTHSVLAVVLVSCHLSAAAWQWPQDSGAERNTKALVQDSRPARTPARQRYDIYDPDSDDFTIPSDYRPGRPGGPGSVPLNRPFPPNGAYAPGAGYGAGGPGGLGGFGATGGYGVQAGGYGGPGGAGVSKCKCAYPGNCPSPSLQFGTCDAGKTYCCTKTGRGLPGGRPVLAGPGGPIGIVKGPGGHGVSGGGLYGGSPYGNGVGPYGGGAYGGGGFGARGDVLYGPRPGGYGGGGGADFVPGPDFNRRPGTTLR